MVTCPECGNETPDGSKHCISCGGSISGAAICPICGAGSPKTAKHCMSCGRTLSGSNKSYYAKQYSDSYRFVRSALIVYGIVTLLFGLILVFISDPLVKSNVTGTVYGMGTGDLIVYLMFIGMISLIASVMALAAMAVMKKTKNLLVAEIFTVLSGIVWFAIPILTIAKVPSGPVLMTVVIAVLLCVFTLVLFRILMMLKEYD